MIFVLPFIPPFGYFYWYDNWIFRIFGHGDDQIVLNALINNRWGVEERYGNVFKEGYPFTIRILVLDSYFKVSLLFLLLCIRRLTLNTLLSSYFFGLTAMLGI